MEKIKFVGEVFPDSCAKQPLTSVPESDDQHGQEKGKKELKMPVGAIEQQKRRRGSQQCVQVLLHPRPVVEHQYRDVEEAEFARKLIVECREQRVLSIEVRK